NGADEPVLALLLARLLPVGSDWDVDVRGEMRAVAVSVEFELDRARLGASVAGDFHDAWQVRQKTLANERFEWPDSSVLERNSRVRIQSILPPACAIKDLRGLECRLLSDCPGQQRLVGLVIQQFVDFHE